MTVGLSSIIISLDKVLWQLLVSVTIKLTSKEPEPEKVTTGLKSVENWGETKLSILLKRL